ncbi:RmlC-like cupin domain-containing protein [Mycena sp. CBHHK59/15]|nr:RmlC-like cupin domain-containing protein [Mycena sp. CBHHK59/15]
MRTTTGSKPFTPSLSLHKILLRMPFNLIYKYYDNNHSQFGSLHVINEDRVAPHTGFSTHSHHEFEISSYIVTGELEHKDSMGNVEVLKRGDLQLTSSGTGISHSEKAHGSKQVHFLQIWSLPSVSHLQPNTSQKRDVWACIIALSTRGLQSPLTLYATLLSDSESLNQTIKGSKGTSTLCRQRIQRQGCDRCCHQGHRGIGIEVELKEGDGAYLHFDKGGELTVENTGDKMAEVLLFNLD